MSYLIAVHPEGHTALWFIDEGIAERVDGAIDYVHVPRDSDPLEAVRATRPGWKFFPLELEPGQYYPRMARPSSARPQQSPGTNPANDQVLIETIRGQLTALRAQLESIFRIVHPVPENFGVFGHDIRNLLILAATEVESLWKGVLSANGVRATNTHDYVKLVKAMKLDEYAVRLPYYPWLEPIVPFRDWKPSNQPSKDLPWYDAYNGVKHDRENEFSRGSLIHAMAAVCGCAVMTFAQFGTYGFRYRAEINSFFELVGAPVWHPSQVYCPPLEGGASKAVLYPFK